MTRLYWLYENLAGTATNTATLLPYTGTLYYARRAGRVRSVTVVLTEARTAGTAIAKVVKNGTAATTLNVTIDGTNTRFKEAFGDLDDLTFVAGDSIGVQVVTSGWTPTTSDAFVLVELEESLE